LRVKSDSALEGFRREVPVQIYPATRYWIGHLQF